MTHMLRSFICNAIYIDSEQTNTVNMEWYTALNYNHFLTYAYTFTCLCSFYASVRIHLQIDKLSHTHTRTHAHTNIYSYITHASDKCKSPLLIQVKLWQHMAKINSGRLSFSGIFHVDKQNYFTVLRIICLSLLF